MRSIALVCIWLGCISCACSCTVIGVAPKATVDGSALVSHSSDAEGSGDPGVYSVPRASHKPHSLRPVRSNSDRSKIIGHVPQVGGSPRSALSHFLSPRRACVGAPQVRSTFAYLREGYAMMNEKQVSMGESTTSSISPVDAVKSVDNGGDALLGIIDLIELGLERCATSRCAVALMGSLAEAHGFYQDPGSPTGEALVVGDPSELWIFHILPSLGSQRGGAIWAASRVPDDHVTSVANNFVIRTIDPAQAAGSNDSKAEPRSHSRRQLYSSSLLPAARSLGWDGSSPLDFTATFGATSDEPLSGEYGGKYYAGRRVWRALSLLGLPSATASLPFEYGDLARDAPYPESLPAANLTLSDVIRVHRDYYQGTEVDLSTGLAAGPWGTPNRFLAPDAPFPSGWPRAISIYRTTCSWICQMRGWLPGAAATVWFGPHTAHGTVYVPLAVGMASAPEHSLPPAYAGGFALDVVDRSSSHWAHKAIQTLAEARFAWVAAELAPLQDALHAAGEEAQAKADKALLQGSLGRQAAPLRAHAAAVRTRLWALYEQLLVRYSDGFARSSNLGPEPVGMGYPAWWLDAVGYADGTGSQAVVGRAALSPSDVTPLAEIDPPVGPPGAAGEGCDVPGGPRRRSRSEPETTLVRSPTQTLVQTETLTDDGGVSWTTNAADDTAPCRMYCRAGGPELETGTGLAVQPGGARGEAGTAGLAQASLFGLGVGIGAFAAAFIGPKLRRHLAARHLAELSDRPYHAYAAAS